MSFQLFSPVAQPAVESDLARLDELLRELERPEPRRPKTLLDLAIDSLLWKDLGCETAAATVADLGCETAAATVADLSCEIAATAAALQRPQSIHQTRLLPECPRPFCRACLETMTSDLSVFRDSSSPSSSAPTSRKTSLKTSLNTSNPTLARQNHPRAMRPYSFYDYRPEWRRPHFRLNVACVARRKSLSQITLPTLELRSATTETVADRPVAVSLPEPAPGALDWPTPLTTLCYRPAEDGHCQPKARLLKRYDDLDWN